MNVSERYGMPLDPPQHVLDATRGLHEHRLANKLWSSADDDRRRADVLVDGSNDRAARVARIGLWRSQDVSPGMSPVSPGTEPLALPSAAGNHQGWEVPSKTFSVLWQVNGR